MNQKNSQRSKKGSENMILMGTINFGSFEKEKAKAYRKKLAFILKESLRSVEQTLVTSMDFQTDQDQINKII